MQTILIVEDDTLQLHALQNSIQQAYPDWTIHTATDIDTAQTFLNSSLDNNNFYSMFLLDINLVEGTSDESGFELAKSIRACSVYFKTPILFLTSFQNKTNFALSTFHCYNFIVKPYSADDILFEIKQMLLTGFLSNNCIMITDTYRITRRILLSDILYIEVSSHLLILHTKNGNVNTRDLTMSEIQQQLSENFVRCHRKFIVNLKYVDNYDRNNRYIHMKTITLPVSRGYKDSFEFKLNKPN